MTQEGDLVLTYIKDKPAFFARIENIEADIKPDWFKVKMLVLQVPLVTITWILREAYINGEEFTMGGHPVKMVKVIAPETGEGEAETQPPVLDVTASAEPGGTLADQPTQADSGSHSQTSKVVSLMDRRKKNSD